MINWNIFETVYVTILFILFKIKDVKSCLTEVKSAVRIKFDARHKPPQNSVGPKDDTRIDNDADNTSVQLPETPSDEPPPKEDTGSRCTDLLKIIKNNNDKEVLIIYARSNDGYSVYFPADKIERSR